MDPNLKTGIWGQFGAVINFLAETIDSCPDDLWQAQLWKTPNIAPEFSQFWYVAYHAIFWLDLYLTGTEDGFLPPAPFTLIEQHEDGPLPDRVYTKDELRAYLQEARATCRAKIEALTDEDLEKRCWFPWGEVSFFELLIYNLRHVHGHAAQLNMLLGQIIGPQPDYVTRVRE